MHLLHYISDKEIGENMETADSQGISNAAIELSDVDMKSLES